MGIMAWLVVGFVAGALARSASGYNRSTDNRSRIGCLGTTAVGAAGGLIGGSLSTAAGGEPIGEFGLRSIFLAFVGAVVLLMVLGALRRSSR